MLTAIRQWVLKTMMKGQTGVVQTLPKKELIELNTQITAERMMRNGINPEDMKTVGQVENVMNQIDTPKVNVNPGVEKTNKATVYDLKGNKIDTSKGIMGGEEVGMFDNIFNKMQNEMKGLKEVKPIDELQNYTKSKEDIVQDLVDQKFGKGYFDDVDESEAAIKARLEADNKKGIAGIKISLVDDSIAKIKSMEPMDAMKEANLVAGKKGRYSNLDDNQVKKIMDDTEDHIFERDVVPSEFDPEYAIGGRVGLKGGAGKAFIEFLKNAGKTMNDKSPVQAYKDYLKSVKDRAQKGDMKTLAPEMGIIAGGGILTNRFLKKKLEKMNEDAKAEVENKADGGRIGLKGGMTKRAFMKLMGGVGASIGAAKSGIFSGFGKGAGKTVAKEVAQQTTSSMPPPYFFKLAEKIKMMGDDATATTERTIAKTLKSKDGKSTYLLEEDITSGDTIIKKINKEGDEMITDVEIMELKKGEVVMGKNGKPVKTPDEYEEVTESNSRIYKDEFNDPNYEDGIKVDEIIKEVDDKIPSIKYAQGGLAYMLGE